MQSYALAVVQCDVEPELWLCPGSTHGSTVLPPAAAIPPDFRNPDINLIKKLL